MHESYQLATGHTQGATGPLLAAVDANVRPFSTPTSATIPYIACDQCTSTGANTAPLPHPTVFYNWAHQPVPVGSTVLNHASFGLMSAHTPPPPAAPSQCAPTSSNVPSAAEARTTGDALQSAQPEQEGTSSPHESGYYSSTTSPTPNHHRY